jgi:transposase
MAMGRRAAGVQGELFLTSGDVAGSPGHVFYDRLNALLAEATFDGFVETRCRTYYEDPLKGGRPSLPPGNYFRMLFVGYFEGIDSQRGIAWRCADSLSLREFLGLAWNESSPDHSSLTKIRQRLPEEVHQAVFEWVLKLCAEKKLLTDPSVVGVDSTTIEANAAMRAIVRKDTKQTYREYLKGLMKDEAAAVTTTASASEKTDPPAPPPSASDAPVSLEGLPPVPPAPAATPPEPTLAEIIRFDRKRKDKTCSNADWESPVDADARIAKMKDGRTRLAYKAEHVVDLKSEVILAAELYAADRSDPATGLDSVLTARCHLTQAGLTMTIDGCAQDKGYHAREPLALAETYSLRTYVAEPDRPHRAKWKDVPEDQKKAVYANRRRVKGDRGKALQRRRSEVVERSFAHVCETGGARRSWLRGLAKLRKRYAMAVAARNLGLVMRKLFGIGKPRTLQTGGPAGGNGGKGGDGGEGAPQTPDGLLKRLCDRLRARCGPNPAAGRLRFGLA